MMDFLSQVLLSLAAIGGWEAGKWLREKRRLPFRWKCPQCEYSLKASNHFTEVLQANIAEHTLKHEMEDQDA
jgi:hypothetical protein